MPLGEWLDAFSSHIFADKAWAVDPFGMANRNAPLDVCAWGVA
jgi:hypothetical protein